MINIQGTPSAVMKREVAITPIIGNIVSMCQPILVDRRKPEGFAAALKEITFRAQSKSYPDILIFPEGTVSHQSNLTSVFVNQSLCAHLHTMEDILITN